MAEIDGSAVYVIGAILGVAVLIIPGPAWWRLVALVAVGHLTILASVALFPIPVDPVLLAEGRQAHAIGADAATLNLVPFHSIGPVLAGGEPASATRLLILNAFVLFPAGLYLPVLDPRLRAVRWLLPLALIGGASIELGQAAISAVIGFRYRSIDVDDAILNAIGLGLGWLTVWLAAGVMRVVRAAGARNAAQRA